MRKLKGSEIQNHCLFLHSTMLLRDQLESHQASHLQLKKKNDRMKLKKFKRKKEVIDLGAEVKQKQRIREAQRSQRNMLTSARLNEDKRNVEQKNFVIEHIEHIKDDF